MNATKLIRPKLVGTGRVLYRCASCGELMDPDRAVIVTGRSYHPAHAPEGRPDGR